MRSESPLSASDGDLYRTEGVQLSPTAHPNEDRSTSVALSMKGDRRDREYRWSDSEVKQTSRGISLRGEKGLTGRVNGVQ